MGAAMKRTISLAMGLSLAACSSNEVQPTPEDAGISEDSGVVADAGPLAARYLVSPKGLFGDTPTHNRFLNPDFDLNAEGWLAYPTMSGAMRLPSVQRRFEAESPTRQPILVMPKIGNDFGVGVVGTARAGAGAFEVTVWIGRPTDNADVAVSVSMVGVHVVDGEMALDLAPMDGSTTVIGERTWVQYGLRINEGPVGFANMVVVDEGDVPIYVTGPLMLPATLQKRLVPLDLSPAPRAIADREIRAMKAIAQRFERTLGARPSSIRLPGFAPRD